MTRLVFLISGLVLAVATQAGSNLDQAASDACECMKEPYAKMEEAKVMVMQAMASGDYTKMTAMEGEFAGLQDRVEACFNGLRKKYPDIDQSQALKDKVTAKMQEKCPAPQMGFGPTQ